MSEKTPTTSVDAAERVVRLEGIVQEKFKKVDEVLQSLHPKANPHPPEANPEEHIQKLFVSELVKQTLANDKQEKEQQQIIGRRRKRRLFTAGILAIGGAALWNYREPLLEKFGPEVKQSRIYPYVEKFRKAYAVLMEEMDARPLTVEEKRAILRKKYEDRILRLYDIEEKDVIALGRLSEEIRASGETEFLDLVMRIQSIIDDVNRKKTAPSETPSIKNEQPPEKPGLKEPEKKQDKLEVKDPEKKVDPPKILPVTKPFEKPPIIEDLSNRLPAKPLPTDAEMIQIEKMQEKEIKNFWEGHRVASEKLRKDLREKTIQEREALEKEIELERTAQIMKLPQPKYTIELQKKDEERWAKKRRQFEAQAYLSEKELEVTISEMQTELWKKIQEKQEELKALKKRMQEQKAKK